MKIDSKVKMLDVIVSGNRVVIEEGEEYRLKPVLANLFTNKKVLEILISELKKVFKITKNQDTKKYEIVCGKGTYILDKIIYEVGDPYNFANLYDVLQNEFFIEGFPIKSLEYSYGNRHEIHYKDKKYHLCNATKEKTDEELLSLYFVWLYYIEKKKYNPDFKLWIEFQKQEASVNVIFK
jgi:hypothetical protein